MKIIMGTDIHISIEKFDGKQWRWTAIKVEDNRRYDLFSILANVRNGYGFAGVKTGEGFIPISEPRGFPEDVDPRSIEWLDDETEPPDSDGYREHKEHLWGSKADGEHDESWLLLSEILDYDYSQKTIKTGAMEEKAYLEYRRTGIPKGYCGNVWGQNIVTLSEPQYEVMARGEPKVYAYALSNEEIHAAYIKGLASRSTDIQLNPDLKYYVQVQWEVTYEECVGYWVKALREQLAPLGDPKTVRLVFNFDS